MKINWIKYLFIIFAIGIMVFAVIKIKGDEENKKQIQTSKKETVEEKITKLSLGIAEFDTINPILSNNKNVQDIAKLIYEPLVNVTEDYNIEPCLATQWAKQNNTTYIIKLRNNVKWSDGNNFTATDVRYTIDRLKDTTSIYSYNVQYVVEVEVVDNDTVKIILDREIPFFEYNLTFPIMSSKYYENEDFKTTGKNNKPIGTGMYMIKDVQQSNIQLEPNLNWWNAENKNLTLDKITINLYENIGELYNSFKIGNIDLISTNNENLQDHIGTIGYNKREIKGREHTFIALNTKNYLLSKSEIRKAISYSIDKSNVISSIYGDKYYQSSFPLDFGTWVYQEKDSSAGYNPNQAKQVLVDNGWDYKYKYWQKYENYRTQRISVNFVVKASDSRKVLTAENIKTQLENQGLRINLIKASDSQYSNYLQNKNYDMILCTTYLSASPNLTTYFGENNLANYENEEINNLMNEVKNTTDNNKIKENYKRIAEINKTEIPYISLYNNKYTTAYNSELVGDVKANWCNIFYNIENWYK